MRWRIPAACCAAGATRCSGGAVLEFGSAARVAFDRCYHLCRERCDLRAYQCERYTVGRSVSSLLCFAFFASTFGFLVSYRTLA